MGRALPDSVVMVGPGFLTIGWQHAAVSLLLCLLYALLYPQLRERAFRLWIAGWAFSSLFGFASGSGSLQVRVVALLGAIGGSALLLGSIMDWIGWQRRLHYLWPLGLSLIGITSLGFVLAPKSVFAWWGAHLLHANVPRRRSGEVGPARQPAGHALLLGQQQGHVGVVAALHPAADVAGAAAFPRLGPAQERLGQP